MPSGMKPCASDAVEFTVVIAVGAENKVGVIKVAA